MNKNTTSKIGFIWILILLSYLLSSCGTTTANKVKETWKHQPETSTYISQGYNIKLSFPNKGWKVYISPQEVPQGMRRFWKSYRKDEPVDILMAMRLDNILFKLTVVYASLTEPTSLDVMMDYMIKHLRNSKNGEHSLESRIIQKPDGRIGIITFRVKSETPTKWLYAFVEEKGRLVWFAFHTYETNPITLEYSDCWDIINSYEYFDKPGQGKKYIKIIEPDNVYAGGKVKFSLVPGDVLEVIRKKTCLGGTGECWEVRNIQTGETGFVSAKQMESSHYVYLVVA
jgi:hypothetical protein